jgi:hypothetical protein
MKNALMIDSSISDAVDAWIQQGLNPGTCTELLLRGDYDRAFLYAHPLIKRDWNDYIAYMETLPPECRGENFDSWKGKKQLSIEEWRKEGERRFGKDSKQWEFVCPACKTTFYGTSDN